MEQIDNTERPPRSFGIEPYEAHSELMTVDDVAAVLRVSRSWVYEHTRMRGGPRSERLPYIKLGKYVRFEPRAIRAFIANRSRTS